MSLGASTPRCAGGGALRLNIIPTEAGAPLPRLGPDNGTTDCNTWAVGEAVLTGSRSACVSSDGAFDMVGNLADADGDACGLSG